MKVQKFHWDSHKQYLYEYEIPDEEILRKVENLDTFVKMINNGDTSGGARHVTNLLKKYESVRCYVSDTYQIPLDHDSLKWTTSCFKAGKECLDPEGELLEYA